MNEIVARFLAQLDRTSFGGKTVAEAFSVDAFNLLSKHQFGSDELSELSTLAGSYMEQSIEAMKDAKPGFGTPTSVANFDRELHHVVTAGLKLIARDPSIDAADRLAAHDLLQPKVTP